MILPGDKYNMTIELSKSNLVESDLNFIVRDNSRTVATGVIRCEDIYMCEK